MPTCVSKGCRNRSSTKSYRQKELEETMKITFHALPRDGMRRQLWLSSLGLEESSLPKQAVICSAHFRNKDFDKTSLSCIRLKSDAVPYAKFLENAGEGSSDECTQVSNQEALSSALRLALKQKTNHNSDTLAASRKSSVRKCSVDSISFDEPLEKVPRMVSPSKSECQLQALLQATDESVQVRMSCVDKSTSISPERLFHSPEKVELRKQAASMKRIHQNQMKSMKQKYRRCSKKIANLQAILQSLKKKNLLHNEHIEILKDI